jgi:hypothetical protein
VRTGENIRKERRGQEKRDNIFVVPLISKIFRDMLKSNYKRP